MTEQEIGRKLRTALHELEGKTIMYNTREYKIRGWRIKDGVVIIVAEPEWIELVERGAWGKIRKEFLPVADEKPDLNLSILPKNGEITDLKNILIENIKRVQTDDKFVQQANAINKSVNAVINLGKLELSFFKAKRED